MKKSAVPSILVAVVLLALGVTAEAQQPKKVALIGFLSSGDPAVSPPVSRHSAGSARPSLHRWTEHRHRVSICGGEARWAPQLAADLVSLKVDIIVAGGDPGIRAAKNATKTIPIVMAGRGRSRRGGLR